MNKYYLTQEQWNEMVTAQLKETGKDLDAGTAKLVPYKEARARIMKHIEDIAEKEHVRTALSYQANYSYETDAAPV